MILIDLSSIRIATNAVNSAVTLKIISIDLIVKTNESMVEETFMIYHDLSMATGLYQNTKDTTNSITLQ